MSAFSTRIRIARTIIFVSVCCRWVHLLFRLDCLCLLIGCWRFIRWLFPFYVAHCACSATFGVTPPFESSMYNASQCERNRGGGQPWTSPSTDVKRVCLFAHVGRPLFIETKQEDQHDVDEDDAGKFMLLLYDKRGAAMNWQVACTKVPQNSGLQKGNLFPMHLCSHGASIQFHGAWGRFCRSRRDSAKQFRRQSDVHWACKRKVIELAARRFEFSTAPSRGHMGAPHARQIGAMLKWLYASMGCPKRSVYPHLARARHSGSS